MNATLQHQDHANWTTKVWGRTKELIANQHYAAYELEIAATSFCSLHYHNQRANRFIVETGSIAVVEIYGPKIVITTLGPDNSHAVPSLVPHMFIVLKDGRMFEEYYADRGGVVQRNDIVRLIEGDKIAKFEDCHTFIKDLLTTYGN